MYNSRMTNHNKCMHLKSSNDDNNCHDDANVDNASTISHIKETMIYNNSNIPMAMKNNKWPDNTLLITEDSILNNLQENRLNKTIN